MTDDKIIHAVNDAAPARDSLVLLDLIGIQFLLRGDIISLRPISQLQPIGQLQLAVDNLACGALEFEGALLPVFYVNHNLQLQTHVDSRCAAVAILAAGSQRFALACLGLEKQATPVFYPVPRSMSSRKQPFKEFAVINQKAVGLTSGSELLRVLQLRGVSLQSQSLMPRSSALR